MSITINAEDPRSIRAIELAAEANLWLSGHNARGEDVYGVPSQSEPGRYYIVTATSCDCPDFHNNAAWATLDAGDERHACKHILAVRLHIELVKAQRLQPRARGHLTVL